MKKDTNQTAMQELRERLKRNIEEMPNEKNQFTQGYKAGLSFVIECATNLLEKEKEQLKKADINGANRVIYNSTEYGSNKLSLTFEEYYNQTYNK